MKIHIFIDAENVPVNNALDAYEVLRGEDDGCLCDVVGKESVLSQAYLKLRGTAFHIHNCDYGKNSADLYLTVIIAKAIYEEPTTDIIAIVSNDRDFAPIIQLAVEKRKQVLLLGLTAQAQGLEELLERMKIDMNFVTIGLIDAPPTSESIALEDLPTGLFEYYQKHFKGSTIFAKRDDKIVEIPFVEGMHVNLFIDLMRRCRIWSRTQNLSEGLEELFLKTVGNHVRFADYAEEFEHDHPMIKKMPDDLKKFYREKYIGENIFVSRNGKVLEMPFVEGMHLGRMVQLMRHFGVWSRSQKIKVTMQRLEDFGLRLKGDYVFRAR